MGGGASKSESKYAADSAASKHPTPNPLEKEEEIRTREEFKVIHGNHHVNRIEENKLQGLAFGDSPSKKDQKREYDQSIVSINKAKNSNVEWNDSQTFIDTKADDKPQPQSKGQDLKPKQTTPLGKAKPPPPATPPIKTTAKASDNHPSPAKPINTRPPPASSHATQGGKVSPVNSVKAQQPQQPAPNNNSKLRGINSKVKSISISDSSDDDDVGEELYDWTNPDNNIYDSSKSRPSSLQSTSLKSTDDEYCATFSSSDSELIERKRPSNVPPLVIPHTTTSPLVVHDNSHHTKGNPTAGPAATNNKPAPPPRLNTAAPPPTSSGPTSQTPSRPLSQQATPQRHVGLPTNVPPPVNTNNHNAHASNINNNNRHVNFAAGPNVSPMNNRKISIPQNQPHEVKETNDVKRNKAQIPQQMMHAKPTTGDWLNKRYIVNNYILLNTLGTGSYGEVRLCKDRRTDLLYAIKIISKDMLNKKKGGRSSETYFEDIKREIAIMKKLNHLNVLRLYEVLDDPKVNKLYLVLEYMKHGDLLHFLRERDSKEEKESGARQEGLKRKNSDFFNPLSQSELWVIFKQTVAAIRYLHFQNVVHGDIKPHNILVGDDMAIKIADFGISKMLHGSSQQLEDAAGTPAFMSPELCAGKAFSGQLADIWAIGATMYMLYFGTPPFVAGNIVALYNKIIEDPLEFPPEPKLDPGLRNLLVNMLEKDPARRFTLDQVITHPWLRFPPQNKPSSAITSATTIQKTHADSKLMKSFILPEHHEANEAKPCVPITALDNDEIFMSIGLTRSKIKEVKEVEDNSDSSKSNDEDDNILATNWGMDVFEQVDDDFDSGSEDGDDEEVDDEPRKQKVVTSTSKQQASTPERNEKMDDDEISRRQKHFQTKTGDKEFKTIITSELMRTCSDSSSCDEDDAPSPSKKERRARQSDAVEILNDFESIMDTLAMIPTEKCASLESVDSREAPIETLLLADMSKNSHSNELNGIVMVSHSEKGQRKSQEDREIMVTKLINILTDSEIEKLRLGPDDIDHLAKISAACIFDGHSGDTSSEYLHRHFVKRLMATPNFLSKKLPSMLVDVCEQIDKELCAVLKSKHDNSGSTGTIMLYDGRNNILTVANVGDSKCIVSRSGKAVHIHKTFRLGESKEESDRVVAAGGSIINKRVNGVLAVSRAFGDTQFKDEFHRIDFSPVIPIPDVHAEIVTPMTEFVVVACDGLWDTIEPQAVIDFIRRRLNKGTDPKVIIQELVKEALKRGSIDNVTAILVIFHVNMKK